MWIAFYEDNTVKHQASSPNFKDLDKNGIRRFCLGIPDEEKTVFTAYVMPGDKIIYRLRTTMREGVGATSRIHVVEIQHKGSSVISFIHEHTGMVESLAGYIDDDIHHPIKYQDHDLKEVM